MMSEYTTIDDNELPWRMYNRDLEGVGVSDEDMADEGWTPIMSEAEVANELRRQADLADQMYFGDDRTGADNKWGAKTVAENLRARADELDPTRRKPWQDLTDLLAEWSRTNKTSQATLEQFLYERGVRVISAE